MNSCIFVPWDASDCARRALEHAIRSARSQHDCSIHVAHAVEEPLIYGEIAVYVPPEKMAQLQREHSQATLSEAIKLLAIAQVPHEVETLVGPVGKVLADRAAALGCDSIIMGTHGRGSVGGLLMGSVAASVIHVSRIPVTLVK